MTALSNMGYCLVANGQHEKALPVLERCLSIIREHLPGDHMDVAKGETVYYAGEVVLIVNNSDSKTKIVR